jgi:hypothetical protein
MSDDWCDDDRAPLRTTPRCHAPASVPDIPVWKVLKEMYDEEKQQLASHDQVSVSKIKRHKQAAKIPFLDSESFDFIDLQSYTEFKSDTVNESDNSAENNVQNQKEDDTVNSHIMDEVIYKKFSYL